MDALDERSDAVARALARQAASLRVPGGSIDRVKRRARQRRQRRSAGIGVVSVAASLGGLATLAARDTPSSLAPTDETSNPSSTQDGTTSSSATDSTDGSAPASTLGVTALAKGASGPDVIRVQDRLRALGFDPGPSDGTFGTQTQQAVWAFEGLVLGRSWAQQTGSLDREALDKLFDPALAIDSRRSGVGNHTEIYLDRQVLAVFHEGEAVLITHISSGSGEQWCDSITQDTDDYGQPLDEPSTKDVCGVSKTPGGVFKVYRRLEGNRQGPLGGMYNPVYFNYGIAVAGAVNVPREPVSRGAIRIPMAIADYFPSLVENGDDVFVWDGIKEPEVQSREETLPVFIYPNPAGTTAQSSTT